jgi:plastocyanin
MRPSAIRRVGRTRAWAVAAILCALPVLLSGAEGSGPAHGADGAVVGTVRLPAVQGSPPPMLSPYARPRYRPPPRTDAASRSSEGVVVYLQGRAPVASTALEPARIVQRNRTILPHVTAIQVGTRVDFPNEDDVFHNLFSLSASHRFNLGRYPPGESQSEQFTRPGVVRLFCDIHSEMGGVILVLDTPYFTKADADGGFRIAGVPPGEYTAIAWHELAGADSTRIVVRDGAETTVDFAFER